jgi:hypothetical protein
MEQVQSEYFEALRMIAGEQNRQLGQAPAGESMPEFESVPGELSLAAREYLSRAVAILSGPFSASADDPLPLLAQAGALIAFELARIVRSRRQVASGELISQIFLEEEGSDLAIEAFRVTNPITGRFAGIAKQRQEAEAMLRRLCRSAYCGGIATVPIPPTVVAPTERLLHSPGGDL